MKYLWLHSMRAYIKLGLFFYYKKIEVRNAEMIPKDQPVLFLANHQNALLDALLIAIKNGRLSYFLTRASVFNNSLVSKLLKSYQLIPVYRVRDGWGNLSKNNSVFTQSSKLLSENNAIVIFPEGSHNLKRTIRTLSKGFTRIIFETLERYPTTRINIVPVGLNFQNATQFADSTLINFGKSIQVNAEILENKHESVLQLKNAISNQLQQLTTHIEEINYDATIKKLYDLNADFTKPEDVNECIANQFEDCKVRKKPKQNILKRSAKLVLIVCLIVPYLIWKKVAQPKIKELEFTSTFRFAVALTLVPLFILLVMIILGSIYSMSIAFLYLLIVIVLQLLAVKL